MFAQIISNDFTPEKNMEGREKEIKEILRNLNLRYYIFLFDIQTRIEYRKWLKYFLNSLLLRRSKFAGTILVVLTRIKYIKNNKLYIEKNMKIWEEKIGSSSPRGMLEQGIERIFSANYPW